MNLKVKVDSFHLMGISMRTSNEDDLAMKDLKRLWNQFYSDDIHSKVSDKASEDIYAVYTDYESNYRGAYTVIIGFKVRSLERSIPAGFTLRTFSGGSYVQYTSKGKLPDAVIGQWREIWNNDAILNRAYSADFEIYGELAKNPGEAEVELLVAVK